MEEKKPPFSYYANERKERLHKILLTLSQNNKPTDINPLVAKLSFECGLRSAKVEEYVTQLEQAGLIEIEQTYEAPLDSHGRGKRLAKITDAGRKQLTQESEEQ